MRDIVLTVFILALLPLCFLRPWLGVIVWNWFGLMNPHRLTWSYAYDMPFALLIGGATLLGIPFAKDRKPIPWNAGLVLVALLVCYFTFTTFYAWAPDAAWVEWMKVAKIVLMTFVATMFIYGKGRIYALMMTIALSIGFYGVKGAIFVVRSGGGERVQGPDGSFMEGNTFIGLAFNMVLPLLIVLARDEKRVWLKYVLYVTAGMTVVATVFTYSRGAYLGLAAVIPLLFLRSRRKWLALAILVPSAFVALQLLPEKIYQRAETIETYQEDRSSNQRLQSWSVAWNLARDHPITGGGFNFEYAPKDDAWLAYGDEKYAWALSHSSAAHSIYFQVLGQHGFIAFFMYLALLIATLWTLQRIRTRSGLVTEMKWVGDYATGIQIGIIGYMVSGAFLSSAYFDLAYLFFAMTAIFSRELRNTVPMPATQATAGGRRAMRSAPTNASPQAGGAPLRNSDRTAG